jgi:putative ABC transport system substrate-binding protein
MNKKTLSWALLCILVLTLISALLWKAKHSEPNLAKICITQIATHPGIDAIRNGFTEELKRLHYNEGRNVTYLQTNAQGDMAVAQSIAQKYANENCDLIFAISTPSSQAVAKAITGTQIPLVFGAVTDPIAAGLVASLSKPGGNITGTSDAWPISDQFQLLLDLAPKVKKIGVVFNPGESNAESNLREVEKVCRAKGLEVIKVAISSTNEVQAAAESLVGRCDAIYVPADNTVIAAMDALVRVSERNKIPLLPGVSSNVEQGGFGTLGPDYHDIGVTSADLADQILRGKKAGDLPVATATRFEYFFNQRSALASGVVLPNELLAKAAKVYR